MRLVPRVLIIEDEQDLASLLEFNLREAGLEPRVAHTGAAALTSATDHPPDVVLLDINLPDVSGIEVCRRLRSTASTRSVPVVMLTALGDEADRVRGFEAGADDYVVKPFSVRELVLRVKAVLRRTSAEDESAPVILAGPIRLEPATHRCFVEGAEVHLTLLEFRLLHRLASRLELVQTRESLLQEVWGLSSELETRTVDTHVMRLRDKLGPARDCVKTVRGVGYRLVIAPWTKLVLNKTC